jgi:hypothetical protein
MRTYAPKAGTHDRLRYLVGVLFANARTGQPAKPLSHNGDAEAAPFRRQRAAR